MSNPNRMPVVLTAHVVEAYRVFYPDASRAEVQDAIDKATPVDTSIVLTLCGRPAANPNRRHSTYAIHEERSGIFAFAESERDPGTLAAVTFLRLYSFDQHEHACKLIGAPSQFNAETTYRSLACAKIQQSIWDNRAVQVDPELRAILDPGEVPDLRWRSVDRDDTEGHPPDIAHFTTLFIRDGKPYKLFLRLGQRTARVFLLTPPAADPRQPARQEAASESAPSRSVLRAFRTAAISPDVLTALEKSFPIFAGASVEDRETYIRRNLLPCAVEVQPEAVYRYTASTEPPFEIWLKRAHRECWFVSLDDRTLPAEVRRALETLYAEGYVTWCPKPRSSRG